MKIAFTATGTQWDSLIDARFGRAEYIVIYDDQNKSLTAYDNSAVKNEAHGAGTATSQKVFELKPDVVITGNGPGETALKVLKLINIQIFTDAHNMTLAQAFEHYSENKLKKMDY